MKVDLSPRDLRDVARLLSLLTGEKDEMAVPGTAGKAEPAREQLMHAAATAFRERKRRMDIFKASMFGEPAWDMLLVLYMVSEQGPRLTFGRLIETSGTPVATAKRWVDYLEDQNLVRKIPHPTDARTYFVELTKSGMEALDRYFTTAAPSDG